MGPITFKLIRDTFTDKSTSGKLFIDGVFECFTLEDKVQNGAKIAGKSAIPAGTYKLDVTYSPRFKTDMPILYDVPGFMGVRIHTGNKAEDTEGCILVGQTRSTDVLGASRMAYNALLPKIKARLPCFITVG